MYVAVIIQVMFLDNAGTSPTWWNPSTWNWRKVGEGIGLVF